MQPLLPEHPVTLIVGTGLLGASLGLAMKQAGYAGRVLGLNRRVQTSAAALKIGAIDAVAEGYAAAAGADLIVVSVPLSAFGSVFGLLAPHLKPGVVITDLGSTKNSVQQAAERNLPDAARFVGSHPMAGSEKQGPEAADAGLFAGKPCVVTPSDISAPDAIAAVDALWAGLQMNPINLSPKAHDEHVAATSHLPHALAVALVNTTAELTGYDTASTGFRDTTRLASSNPSMRLDIMRANQPALTSAIDAVILRLQAMKAALSADEPDDLSALLMAAKKRRDAWIASRKK